MLVAPFTKPHCIVYLNRLRPAGKRKFEMMRDLGLDLVEEFEPRAFAPAATLERKEVILPIRIWT
jgi:hypothetical protein